METVIKAEYIQKMLCQTCMVTDHDECFVREPYRKVVQDIRGVITCTNCGKRVSQGYIVIYEYIGQRAG